MKIGKLLLLGLLILPMLNITINVAFALAPQTNFVPMQENETATTGDIAKGYQFVAMALSTGLAAIGAGIAVGYAGSSAIASITEKPELFGRAIIIVGLAEGIAIYGLLISFLIWIS